MHLLLTCTLGYNILLRVAAILRLMCLMDATEVYERAVE